MALIGWGCRRGVIHATSSGDVSPGSGLGGTFQPSTLVALKLSRVLGRPVEALFALVE
jgi:hypothetical protein